MKEMVGQRELIAAFAGVNVEDVRGMRAPFLAVSVIFQCPIASIFLNSPSNVNFKL